MAVLLGSRAGDETHALRPIFTHSAAYGASLLEYVKGISTFNGDLMILLPVPCSSQSHVIATSPSNGSGPDKKLEAPRSPFSHTLHLITQEMEFSSSSVCLQSDRVSLCL